MKILEAMSELIQQLSAHEELDVDALDLPTAALHLSNDSVVAAMSGFAAIANHANRAQAVLAGVAAHRSRRESGHTGLAAVHGHATPAALIQAITGGTKADAQRHVRVGTALLDGTGAADPATGPTNPAFTPAAEQPPWHEPLRRALLDGRLTSAQQDAIRTGLGEPNVAGSAEPSAAVDEAWSLAAEGFIAEASSLTVEELARRARTVRDMLDPAGAEERFARRYESRSVRRWVDADGQHHARIDFDDEMAIWVGSVLDAALRPRRGGPRFVVADEKAAAADLAADVRSNEQLEYDLLMDLLRAGSLAHAADVFGARQPGVRMVVVKDLVGPRDAFGRLLAAGHAEDGGSVLPGSVIDRALCTTGSVDVTLDRHGNPLDLGREQRLFSPRQRIALAARDGGCVWPGCQRPASYCEAHHCDHFAAHEGRTDVDRGVLLCRFHHMLLHSNGWRIRREGLGPFVLHPPPGDGAPIALKSKAAWKWAWDPPPPDRAGWRAS